MQLKIKKYLYDISEACDLIIKFTNGLKFDDYCKDRMIQSAVERQFEIIGEALSQVIKIDSSILSNITNYRKIINFRNILIHGYASVSNDIVWGIIEKELLILKKEVQEMLAKT
jgi:uncharacterized protein with HEPN domain